MSLNTELPTSQHRSHALLHTISLRVKPMSLIQGRTFCERYGGVVWNQKTQDSNVGYLLDLMCRFGQATFNFPGPLVSHLYDEKWQASNERWYL